MGSFFSPPKAPDYEDMARQSAKSRMSNEYTPFGTLTYKEDPTSPSGYSAESKLSGGNAQLYSDQLRIQQRLLNQLGHASYYVDPGSEYQQKLLSALSAAMSASGADVRSPPTGQAYGPDYGEAAQQRYRTEMGQYQSGVGGLIAPLAGAVAGSLL